MTTHNDHLSYGKNALRHIYVFLNLFGYWVWEGGGVSTGIGTQPAYAVFHPGHLKNQSFQNLFFDIVTTHNDQSGHVWFRRYFCVLHA